jgi:hypothetical protein
MLRRVLDVLYTFVVISVQHTFSVAMNFSYDVLTDNVVAVRGERQRGAEEWGMEWRGWSSVRLASTRLPRSKECF